MSYTNILVDFKQQISMNIEKLEILLSVVPQNRAELKMLRDHIQQVIISLMTIVDGLESFEKTNIEWKQLNN